MLVAILAALSASALFATATALQHRSAGLVSATGGVRAGRLSGFMCKTLRHPMWVLGTGAGIAGVALHAIALRDGPLSLVQPLQVTGVIFALALRRLLEHRRPRRDELGWAVALALGVALFLAVATPANGSTQPPDLAPTVLCGALIGLGVLGCCVASRRTTANIAAVLLGTAAGLAFAAVAGLLKETMDILNRGAGALVVAWPPYALVIVGAIGVVLNQLAYQAGPLSFSLPAITSVDPVVSLVIAVAVFDEHFRNGARRFARRGSRAGLGHHCGNGPHQVRPAFTPRPGPRPTRRSSVSDDWIRAIQGALVCLHDWACTLDRLLRFMSTRHHRCC